MATIQCCLWSHKGDVNETQVLMGLMSLMEVVINEQELLTVGTGQIG